MNLGDEEMGMHFFFFFFRLGDSPNLSDWEVPTSSSENAERESRQRLSKKKKPSSQVILGVREEVVETGPLERSYWGCDRDCCC